MTQETLFDERNLSMILLSKELENALDRKALHILQARDLVSKQIIFAFEYPVRVLYLAKPKLKILMQYGLLQTTYIATHINTSKMARFRLRPLFLEVIRLVEGTNQKKSGNTYLHVS